MAGFGIDITGSEEIVAKLGLELSEVAQAVADGVNETALNIHTAAQRNAMFTQGYQTGATRSGIHVEQVATPQDPEATVESNTNYSEYLEFGTRRMSAQPFMTPAKESEGGRLRTNIGKHIARRMVS